MSDTPSVAEQLIRAWLASPDVSRVTHDDDDIAPRARMRPTTDLAKAAAVVLQGFGYVMPVGDGSYLVQWRSA